MKLSIKLMSIKLSFSLSTRLLMKLKKLTGFWMGGCGLTLGWWGRRNIWVLLLALVLRPWGAADLADARLSVWQCVNIVVLST